MCQLVPKWGYNNELPGNGGGIQSKRMNSDNNHFNLTKAKNNIKNFLDHNNRIEAYSYIFNNIKNFLDHNNRIEAYSYIFNCGAPNSIKNYLLKKYNYI